MNAPLISSQRHLDLALVAKKAARFAVFAVHVADVTLRGKPYRIVIDGHHNLAAAKIAGAEPTWRAPAAKWRRIEKSMSPAQFERFLINNLTDSEYYFVDTGEVVQELLGVEPARTTTEDGNGRI
ncbi:hypothetical protein [Burkholderia glumae]|uniref:hypothetical protein n=1 Tax=Burkholderia glumae TaxID=337 RepID=UPI0005BAC354|nr:hypothetical protein [Burkholderia glumae]PJO24859.1 hypothetical protein Y5A_000140 [Burkholderia glumae AU6208]QHE11823.1 hypothetical protein GQR88_16375 [Burkholderia glumae AU6208]QHE12099.1 hypothetical protein GQR88_16785 [Burkholderia glumae AU6208]